MAVMNSSSEQQGIRSYFDIGELDVNGFSGDFETIVSICFRGKGWIKKLVKSTDSRRAKLTDCEKF